MYNNKLSPEVRDKLWSLGELKKKMNELEREGKSIEGLNRIKDEKIRDIKSHIINDDLWRLYYE